MQLRVQLQCALAPVRAMLPVTSAVLELVLRVPLVMSSLALYVLGTRVGAAG